jgi:hypothetical protein
MKLVLLFPGGGKWRTQFVENLLVGDSWENKISVGFERFIHHATAESVHLSASTHQAMPQGMYSSGLTELIATGSSGFSLKMSKVSRLGFTLKRFWSFKVDLLKEEVNREREGNLMALVTHGC